MRSVTLCLIVMSTLPALAQEADIRLPRERPEVVTAPDGPPLPRIRPDEPPAMAPTDAEPDGSPAPGEASPLTGTPDGALPQPTEPPPEPRVYQTACPAVLNGEVVAEALPPIAEGMCGLQAPLSLSAVVANGRTVPLNTPVTTDCGMATALPGWIGEVDRFLVATEKTRIAEVNVGTGYMCRNANNGGNGNLSFHAFGAAVDVVGFKLEDGRVLSVSADWPVGMSGSRVMRQARDAACTRFTTVLGPEANALHEDHLHLDLGCHGQSCEARICE